MTNSPTGPGSPNKVGKPGRRSSRIRGKNSPTSLTDHLKNGLHIATTTTVESPSGSVREVIEPPPRLPKPDLYVPPGRRTKPLSVSALGILGPRVESKLAVQPKPRFSTNSYNHKVVNPQAGESLAKCNPNLHKTHKDFNLGDFLTVAVNETSNARVAIRGGTKDLVPSPVYQDQNLWIHSKHRPVIVLALYANTMLVIPSHTSGGRGLSKWEGKDEANHCIAIAHVGEDYQSGKFGRALETTGDVYNSRGSYVRLSCVFTLDYEDPTIRPLKRKLTAESTIELFSLWQNTLYNQIEPEIIRLQGVVKEETLEREKEAKVEAFRREVEEEHQRELQAIKEQTRTEMGEDKDTDMGDDEGYS